VPASFVLAGAHRGRRRRAPGGVGDYLVHGAGGARGRGRGGGGAVLRVRQAYGAARVVDPLFDAIARSGEQDLQAARVLLPDLALELLAFQVVAEALGDLSAELVLFVSNVARTGEPGPGLPSMLSVTSRSEPPPLVLSSPTVVSSVFAVCSVVCPLVACSSAPSSCASSPPPQPAARTAVARSATSKAPIFEPTVLTTSEDRRTAVVVCTGASFPIAKDSYIDPNISSTCGRTGSFGGDASDDSMLHQGMASQSLPVCPWRLPAS
jgi:hypothetical protein